MIFEGRRAAARLRLRPRRARACRLALEAPEAADEVFNVGSGRAYPIAEVADRMACALGKPHLRPEITGKYRAGDIRHCFADISKARRLLGYAPARDLEGELGAMAAWLGGQVAYDRVEAAATELAVRGLTV